MIEDLDGESGKYQIVATDEDDSQYVIFSCNDLEVARSECRRFISVIESRFNQSLLITGVTFRSMELQRVERIEV